MYKEKILFTTTIKDYTPAQSQGTYPIEFSVVGIFDTEKVHWTYYVISHVNKVLTHDICGNQSSMNIGNISSDGRKCATKEDGIKYIQDYKDKWEYGSNDTRQEKRDQKIDDVLGT
jgi:hypothetical protein